MVCMNLLLSGCSVIPRVERPDQKQPLPQSVPQTVVISGERLREGGKVFVKPFIPGEHVVSDDAFDRISMHVLKGFLTALQQAPEVYTLLGSEQAEESELLVEGRILEKKTKRVFEKLWRRKTVYVLKVEGTILDRSHNKVVMYFTHELSHGDGEGFDRLAEDVGQDIGHSVLSLLE